MGIRVRRLPDPLEDFVIGFWDTDVREQRPAVDARAYLAKAGLLSTLRKFLTDVIVGSGASPEEWSTLCNVQTCTVDEVRQDATDLWKWLFEAEAPPEARSN